MFLCHHDSDPCRSFCVELLLYLNPGAGNAQQDFSLHAYRVVSYPPVAFDCEDCAASAVLSDSAVHLYRLFRLKQVTFFCWLLRQTLDGNFTISPIYLYIYSIVPGSKPVLSMPIAIANRDVGLDVCPACRYDLSIASNYDFRSLPIHNYDFCCCGTLLHSSSRFDTLARIMY